ncbi:UNVERIFIED_ORG: N-acetylglucosaminyl-diphospho-decaprenol L-rhamnosyltransferase [Arthrobacter sp. UYCu721]
MNKISVVTVTHNSSHIIQSFLNVLLTDRAADAQRVVVVDSGSEDKEATRLAAESSGSVFVSVAKNVGYGTGSNIGANAQGSEWIALVNPDVGVTLDQIEKLVGEARRNNYQCMGPSVLDEEGRLQKSWHPIAAPPWRKRVTPMPEQGDEFPASSISGCCMVIERSWFEKVGGFDESFFMFCEEIDLHKRLLEAGARVGISNLVEVKTPGGASSLGTTKRWSNVERAIAHVQFTTKHYSRLEGAVDAVWRILLISTSPLYKPRLASLHQFAEGIWSRMFHRPAR